MIASSCTKGRGLLDLYNIALAAYIAMKEISILKNIDRPKITN